jgi:hypothetical protein
MTKHAYVVKVPRPYAAPYNPDRHITDLVRNQILHLSLAERHLPEHHRTGVDVYSIETERQASEYIRHITAKLHRKSTKKSKPSKKTKPQRSKPTRKRNRTDRRKKRRS